VCVCLYICSSTLTNIYKQNHHLQAAGGRRGHRAGPGDVGQPGGPADVEELGPPQRLGGGEGELPAWTGEATSGGTLLCE